jgi:hypothetical protein
VRTGRTPRKCPEFLVGRQGEQAQLASKPWTLGLKVPSRRLSTHVHGRPGTSTADTLFPSPESRGVHPCPPMSTGLAVIWLSAKPAMAGDRPRRRPQLARGVRIWEGDSGRGGPNEVPLPLPMGRRGILARMMVIMYGSYVDHHANCRFQPRTWPGELREGAP